MRDKLEAAFKEQHALTLDPRDWDTLYWPKADRFLRLLDAEAWLDAVMMLVPKGLGGEILHLTLERNYLDQWKAEIADVLGGQGWTCFSTAPAEALLSAILSTKENTYVE